MIEPSPATEGLHMEHFEELRNKINQRLRQIGTRHADRQINEFPWLYGALGQVPSEIMLICENPSLSGVEKADARTLTGGAASIEDQWCGGPRSNCIKRLRPALCEVGLKVTAPDRVGGWRCYITNVIKEADRVRDFASREKPRIAEEWADVLAWEVERVSPRVLFTVGDSATKLVSLLQRRRLIPGCPHTFKLMHYSNRGPGVTDAAVRTSIALGLMEGMRAAGILASIRRDLEGPRLPRSSARS